MQLQSHFGIAEWGWAFLLLRCLCLCIRLFSDRSLTGIPCVAYAIVLVLFSSFVLRETRANNDPEFRVAKRTAAALTRANELLQQEIAERKRAYEELQENVTLKSAFDEIQPSVSKLFRCRSKGMFKYVVVHFAAWIPALLTAIAVPAVTCDLHAQQQVVLKNVNVIDGTGRPARADSTVIIAGDRIQAISIGQQPAPANANVIDMRGLTIMPLIINTHGHLGLVKGTSASAANQTEDNFRHQLLRYQEYGVGAVLSMGTDGPKFAELREVSRKGALPGADVYSAGQGIGAKDGIPPLAMGFTSVLRPVTPAEGRQYVAQQAPLKPDFIKIWVDDFWGQYPKLQPEIYKAIIDEAHKDGLRVAAHLYYLDDARSLVASGADVIAHSIRDREVDDALVADMKKQHVAYIPTLSLDDFAFAYGGSPAWINDPFFRAALDPGLFAMIDSPEYKAKVRANKVTAQEEAALPTAMRNLKKIFNAGILVALGTDSGATPIRVQGFAEHMELALMVESGLTPLQAISAATQNAAQLLGVAERYGTLAPGKKANFIVLDKDPSPNIRNTQTIRAVWKNGIKVSDGPLAVGSSVSQ